MTTSEMLSAFRFRMEDPEGDKWDDSSLTEIYRIFTDAQRIAVTIVVDAKKYQHLRELQELSSMALSGGSADLPSDFFLPQFLQDSQGRFVDLMLVPPDKPKKDTDFLEDDEYTAYGYIFKTKLHLQGYSSSSGTYSLGYIKKPAAITASVDPVLSDYMNQLTVAVSEWLGWGLDKQFDRQNALTQEIAITFGVKVQQ